MSDADLGLASEEAPDGRRMRSERSREQIVDALFRLIESGRMHHSAAEVAEAAGVSLRTVFRHFEEMDTLYREMMRRIEADVRPIIDQPYTAKDWKDRLEEMIDRRAALYERVLLFKVCGSIRRFQSKVLGADFAKFAELERQSLKAIVPTRIASDTTRFSALDTALSFEAWRRLRQEGGVSARKAREVFRFTARSLIE